VRRGGLLARVGSIKTKLGLVVAGATAIGLLGAVYGLQSGFRVRWTLLLSLALALLVVQLLARGMTAPLREMAAAATAMARGQHDVRVAVTTRDEVGQLAEAFNAMAAELAAVDAQRRRLVADVSHELRTPLTALQALLENLADGVTRPDPEVLGTALAQTRRSVGWSPSCWTCRAWRPARSRWCGPRSTSAACSTMPPPRRGPPAGPPGRRRRAAPRADRGRRPRAAGPGAGEPPGQRQPAMPRRAAGCWPPPAALPTAYGSRWSTTARASRRGDRERVFDRFTRTDAARARSDGGSGLGLSIVRWVVERHGGTVRVADPPTGGGCRVQVDLPA
jgi:HAMP domain-containing protein